MKLVMSTDYKGVCARCGAKPPVMRLLFRTDTDEAEWVCAYGCKPKEAAMFKVGDKVRIKAELVRLVDSGKVCTVKEVARGGYRLVDGQPFYYAPELELASATHFPIGTKVRALKTEYFSQEAGAGAEGVVVDGRERDVRSIVVRLTMLAPGIERCLSDYSPCKYCYNPEDLDIISLPAKADTSSLKVGDRVRVKRKYGSLAETTATVIDASYIYADHKFGFRFDDTGGWDVLENVAVLPPEKLTYVDCAPRDVVRSTPTIKLLYTVRNTHLLLNGTVEVTLFHEDATKEEETYDAIAITASKEEAKSIHLGDEYTVTIAKNG